MGHFGDSEYDAGRFCMLTLPTLYKKTNTGAIQQWNMRVEGATIITSHGQVNGAVQSGSEEITKGKNIGRANETSPIQQAEAEARARHTKQLKKGYVTSIEAAQAGEVDEVIEGGILPMLAPSKIYPHFAKHIKFPCFLQPKLDGSRCIAIVKDGKCTLWSRTRKQIHSVPHIIEAIERFVAPSTPNAILDGELYNHALKDDFEELMSLIRQSAPGEGHERIEYHIYDMPSHVATFTGRCEAIRALFANAINFEGMSANGVLVRVDTLKANEDKEIQAYHEGNLAMGYEGSMIRNDGPYQGGKRSMHLQKLKVELEDEYTITNAEEGRGKDAGTVGAFVCVTKEGKEFRARLKATYERRRELMSHPETWRGKKLTVVYQNLTADGIPRFPRGKALRDYD